MLGTFKRLKVAESTYLFLVAIQFLTRIPVSRHVNPSLDDLARSSGAFPLVGALLGLCGGTAGLALFMVGVPKELAATIVLALLVAITGAFHEDGWADAFDGLFGGYDSDNRLRIMRDSRIGTFGALALVLLILFRFQVLIFCKAHLWPFVLGLALAWGRWSSLLLLRICPYAPGHDEGKMKPFVESQRKSNMVWINAALLIIVSFLHGKQLWPLAILVPLTTWVFGLYLQSKVGGITGDLLGMVNIFIELSVLLVLVLVS